MSSLQNTVKNVNFASPLKIKAEKLWASRARGPSWGSAPNHRYRGYSCCLTPTFQHLPQSMLSREWKRKELWIFGELWSSFALPMGIKNFWKRISGTLYRSAPRFGSVRGLSDHSTPVPQIWLTLVMGSCDTMRRHASVLHCCCCCYYLSLQDLIISFVHALLLHNIKFNLFWAYFHIVPSFKWRLHDTTLQLSTRGRY